MFNKREVRTSLSFWRNLIHALKSHVWRICYHWKILVTDNLGPMVWLSGACVRVIIPTSSGGAPEKGALLNGEAAQPAGQDHLYHQERRGQRQPRVRLPGDPSSRGTSEHGQTTPTPPPPNHPRSSAKRTCLSPHSQCLPTTEAAFSPTKSTSDSASWKALCPLDVTLWNQPQS